MTGKFYVDVWQPSGQKAEAHARLNTFQDAVDWLRARLAEDAGRLPRMVAYADDVDEEVLAKMGLQR